MGGRTADRTALNDVWRSLDGGTTWLAATASAPWSGRFGHSTVSLPGGGILLTGGALADAGPYLSDVWLGLDSGATWELKRSTSPWSARFQHASVVLPGGDVLITGGRGATAKADIWRSCAGGWIVSANSAGGISCQRCGPGTSSGHLWAIAPSTCIACPAGSYSDTPGTANCTRCPVGTASSQVGASSPGVCQACTPGSHSGQVGSHVCTACVPGTYSDGHRAPDCRTCAPGYAALQAEARGCSKCVAEGACTQGLCTSGRSGAGCAVCEHGTFSVGRECAPCIVPVPLSPAIGILLAAVALASLAAHKALADPVVFGLIMQLVASVQVSLLLLSLPLRWPGFALATTAALRLVFPLFDPRPLECLGGVGFVPRSWITVAVVGGVCAAALKALAQLQERARLPRGRRHQEFWERTARDASLAAGVVVVAQVLPALQAWARLLSCFDAPAVLHGDPGVSCSGAAFIVSACFAGAALLGCGYAVWSAWLFLRNRQPAPPDSEGSWGHVALYQAWVVATLACAEDCRHLEAIQLAQRAVLVLAVTFLSVSQDAVVWAIGAVLAACVAMAVYVQQFSPYAAPALNRSYMRALALPHFVAALCAGVMSLESPTTGSTFVVDVFGVFVAVSCLASLGRIGWALAGRLLHLRHAQPEEASEPPPATELDVLVEASAANLASMDSLVRQIREGIDAEAGCGAAATEPSPEAAVVRTPSPAQAGANVAAEASGR